MTTKINIPDEESYFTFKEKFEKDNKYTCSFEDIKDHIQSYGIMSYIQGYKRAIDDLEKKGANK